jgi:hypothetical protein
MLVAQRPAWSGVVACGFARCARGWMTLVRWQRLRVLEGGDPVFVVRAARSLVREVAG